MIQVFYANAVTLLTTLSGGKNGHVGLIMKYTLYETLATATTYEDLDELGSIPTINKNSTVTHHQQSNETYGKSHQIFENDATMYDALKHQIIETIEDTCIAEIQNKYTWFMVVNKIYLVHHLMDRYGIITETGLKENHKRFYEALDTTMPIDKHFEKNDDYI